MQRQGETLPPAAVLGWYELAYAVIKGVKDPQERHHWRTWCEYRVTILTLGQDDSEGARHKARRMGNFEGGVKPSRNKRYKET